MGNKIPSYIQRSMYENIVLKKANNPTDNSIASRKVAHGVLSLQLRGEIEYEDDFHKLRREPIESLAYDVDYLTMTFEELYDEQKLPLLVEQLCKKMICYIKSIYRQ